MRPYGGKVMTAVILAAALIIIAGLIYDSRSYSDAPDVVEVPVFLDLSGDRAYEGIEYLRGIEIALDDVNSAGGRQFVPVVYDTKGTLEGTVSCFEDVMEKGYRFMLGPMDAVSALYIESTGYDICVLTFSISATQFSEHKNIYRNTLIDRQFANAIKAYLADRCKSVVVLYDESFESQCMMGDLETALGGTGLIVHYVESAEPESVADSLIELNPDIVLSILPASSDLDSIVKLSKDRGLESGWLGIDSSVTDEVAASTDGFYAVTTIRDIPEQSFIEKYEKKYGETPDPKSMYGYDFAMVMSRVVDYDGVSYDRFSDGLQNIRYIGMTGFIKFNSEGDCYSTPNIVVSKDGEWKTLSWKELLSL